MEGFGIMGSLLGGDEFWHFDSNSTTFGLFWIYIILQEEILGSGLGERMLWESRMMGWLSSVFLAQRVPLGML